MIKSRPIPKPLQGLHARLPGIALAVAISALAIGLQALEIRWLGQPILESLVMAILLGMLWRNVPWPWPGLHTGPRLKPGLDFCAKPVLELAVLLLGGTMNLGAILAAGPRLLIAVVLAVTLALAVSTLLARRLFGLPRNPATLIAVGNAICGNSAIAAVAPRSSNAAALGIVDGADNLAIAVITPLAGWVADAAGLRAFVGVLGGFCGASGVMALVAYRFSSPADRGGEGEEVGGGRRGAGGDARTSRGSDDDGDGHRHIWTPVGWEVGD